jgi:hypothetical protein
MMTWKLHVRDDSPIEFEGRAARVDLNGGAVRCSKRVELVVMKIGGLGIVGLKRRTGACNNDRDKSTEKERVIVAAGRAFARKLERSRKRTSMPL